MDNQLEKIAKTWPGIQNIFSVPHNQKEYNRLVNTLDGLIDEVGENESHPLLEMSNSIIGMEIKSRATVHAKDTRPMKRLAQKIGKQWLGGLVIYTGREIKPITEPNIWAVPSHRLFQPS